jgi:hypothetical protein
VGILDASGSNIWAWLGQTKPKLSAKKQLRKNGARIKFQYLIKTSSCVFHPNPNPMAQKLSRHFTRPLQIFSDSYRLNFVQWLLFTGRQT